MPITATAYPNAKLYLLNDTIQLATSPVKIALLNASGVYNSAHTTFANVSGFEASGAGYTAGGLLVNNKAFALSIDKSFAKMSGDNLNLIAATLTFRYGVIYNDATNNGVTKPLIAHLDFGELITLANANYTLTPHPDTGWIHYSG